jgi:hypothetical protein
MATDGAWRHQHSCYLHGKQVRRFAEWRAADTRMCLHYSLFCYAFILQMVAFMDVSCLTTGVVQFNIAVPAGKSNKLYEGAVISFVVRIYMDV